MRYIYADAKIANSISRVGEVYIKNQQKPLSFRDKESYTYDLEEQ